MRNKKLFRCKHCGNIITMVHDSSVKVVCCGEEMGELIPNTEDATLEKHVPVMELMGHFLNVKIGETEHPMTEEHRIEWVYLVTKEGTQLKYLKANDLPTISFNLIDDEPLKVYAWCNLHGLWMKEFK